MKKLKLLHFLRKLELEQPQVSNPNHSCVHCEKKTQVWDNGIHWGSIFFNNIFSNFSNFDVCKKTSSAPIQTCHMSIVKNSLGGSYPEETTMWRVNMFVGKQLIKLRMFIGKHLFEDKNKHLLEGKNNDDIICWWTFTQWWEYNVKGVQNYED